MIWVLGAFLLVAAPVRAGVDDILRDSALSLSAGDVAGARVQAGLAAAAAPRDPRTQEQLARTELAALDFAAAEAAAGRALELGENTARLVLRSQARAGLKDLRGALSDAERAVLLSPGSGPARFRLAAAKEGLGHSGADVLADYRRAAELDVNFAEHWAAAAARLRPPAPSNAGARLGPILAVLAISALFGWIWGKASKSGEVQPAAAARPVLPGKGRLSPRELLTAAAEASRAAPDSRVLAEALYERLLGRPAFPHEADRALGRYLAASRADKMLPEGIDAFFARALDPEPSRRFHSAEELVGALRSVVDPAVL